MSSRPEPPPSDLIGYEVLVAVCGGIAAYKVCGVASELVQRGAGVTVAMTKAARKFVGPVTFEALTGRSVLTSMWARDEHSVVQHVDRTSLADLVLVAPATANMIGKIAAGIADDLVSTLVISAASPVILAPAMNERMWGNLAVERNVATLTERGYRFVGPGEGWLACRVVGVGRMADEPEILEAVVSLLKTRTPRASVDE